MEILTFENAVALLTLTLLEIVLGIDNIIFISIIVSRVEAKRREQARKLGLILAMLSRIALLLGLQWMMLLTNPLFSLFGNDFAGRDLILITGGLFLVGKATHEIHVKLEETENRHLEHQVKAASYVAVLFQILLLDLVFSLDSVITAVGMAESLTVMITAIIVAVLTMLLFAKAIGDFVEDHPTFKMLALSFLLLVGVMLFIEGFGVHVEKGYIYFAIGFSLFVEALNMKVRGRNTSGAQYLMKH